MTTDGADSDDRPNLESEEEPNDDTLERARETALACLHAGIDAADPETVIDESLDLEGTVLSIQDSTGELAESIDIDGFDEVLVLGGGNAVGRAARALETLLGDTIDAGSVVTDAPSDTTVIEQLPGDHPIPSQRGVDSTRNLLEIAREADQETLVLFVVTGGGSALMPAPASGVNLADMQAVTNALLRSGAPIQDVNAVRKHLSDVKGGRLAAALAPARVVTLAFSDVVRNELDAIASGPTVPDSTTYRDALDVLDQHDIDAPESVVARLRGGETGDYPETPNADHPAFDRSSVHILADNFTACDAARAEANSRGYEGMVLTTHVTGPARDAATWHVAIADEVVETGNPIEPPAVLVSGGETTVRVSGDGLGGPNHEFVLAAALDLPDGCVVGAVDTDGIDGNSGVAGAIVDPRTVDDSETEPARAALESNDSYAFLRAHDSIIDTGVTGTNVNDLRVVVIAESGPDTDANDVGAT